MQYKQFFYKLLFLIFTGNLVAADVSIASIEVHGNRKTNTSLMLREMDIQVNDTLAVSELTGALVRNEELLMNTGLFNDVSINIKEWDESNQMVDLQIKVVESWYFFPIPVVKLADRNFNVWWVEQNRDLKRLTYGFKLLYYNATGNNDYLKFEVNGGYKQRFFLSYDRPYINKRKTLGIMTKLFLDQRREFAYDVVENKQIFYDDPNIAFKSWNAVLGLSYKPGVRTRHEWSVAYRSNWVTDQISDLNINFFRHSNRQSYFQLRYTVSKENRDNRFYPLKGHFVGAIITKDGLGIHDDINKFNVSLKYAHSQPISRIFNLENRIRLHKELIDEPHPFYGLDALGFGDDYLHGYEYYVINGTDFAMLQNSLKFNVINFRKDLKNWMPLKNYRSLPVSIWLTANFDFGYVHSDLLNFNNRLNERFLFGRGFGIDIVLYEKYVFQVELSQNHLNETGIFFHVRSDF